MCYVKKCSYLQALLTLGSIDCFHFMIYILDIYLFVFGIVVGKQMPKMEAKLCREE